MKSWRWGDNKATGPESDAEDTRADRVRFFANIVNELRTPLTVILGQLDAALLEQDSDTRGHQIRVASRNARRLERLTLPRRVCRN